MINLNWTDEQLKEAGLDRKKVESIARRLSRLGREMQSMGLSIYGAAGSGNLIHKSRQPHKDHPTLPSEQIEDYGCVIADLDGVTQWDGGDW
jgi:hypothetical protein